MNKGVVWFLVLIVLAVAVYFFVFKGSEGIDFSGYNQNSSQEGNVVEIKNFIYSPKELTISVGESVTWTNYDSSKHTVTSDTGSLLDSELFGQGENYAMTFTEAGTYSYHCTPHPYMKGKIIVQ